MEGVRDVEPPSSHPRAFKLRADFADGPLGTRDDYVLWAVDGGD